MSPTLQLRHGKKPPLPPGEEMHAGMRHRSPRRTTFRCTLHIPRLSPRFAIPTVAGRPATILVNSGFRDEHNCDIFSHPRIPLPFSYLQRFLICSLLFYGMDLIRTSLVKSFNYIKSVSLNLRRSSYSAFPIWRVISTSRFFRDIWIRWTIKTLRCELEPPALVCNTVVRNCRRKARIRTRTITRERAHA